MNALAAAHDAAVQMIDTSIVRVHQHAACNHSQREEHLQILQAIRIADADLSESLTRSHVARAAANVTALCRQSKSHRKPRQHAFAARPNGR
jgi:hypothetical protein